jgi:hypothetical protein
LINADSKLCMVLWAAYGFGKTRFAATLDKMTKRFFNKPSLIIAVEPGEGGGTMSIQNYDVDFVVPNTFDELNALVAALQTDRTYAGVALDSATEMVNRFLKPYALQFPSREHIATRVAGVPERSDYQTMGEACRKLMNQLIKLTTLEDLSARKHLLVTALDRTKEDNGRIVSVGPDLPGAMASACGAMFQTVGEIRVIPKVENVGGKPVRTSERRLVTHGDGVRLIKDRTGCFPAECELDLETIWPQYWLPRIEAARAVPQTSAA